MLSREDEGGSQNPTINVHNHDHDTDRDYDQLLENGVGDVGQEDLTDDINNINTGILRRIIRNPKKNHSLLRINIRNIKKIAWYK